MRAEFTALCSKTSLPEIRAFVKKELSDLGLEEAVRYQLVLAVDEACANSIIHQHQCDGTTRIKLSVYQKGDALHIELNDIGTPFPIDQYQPKELEETMRQRLKGGLGILLITKIMDKVEVIREKGGFTYRFVKRIP